MPKREKTAIVQIPVRMREDLRAKLAQQAKEKRCSLNFEIVSRLRESIEEKQPAIDLHKLLKEQTRQGQFITAIMRILEHRL